MNTRVAFALFLVITVLAEVSYAGCFDGCSVETHGNNVLWTKFRLRDFENNHPKKKELIRTKFYFKDEIPIFSVHNSGFQVFFGVDQKAQTFAIHTAVNDFTSDKYLCDVIEDVKEFDGRYFVEVAFILEKTGRFSVLIDGSDSYVLTCNTGYTFDDTNEISVYISYDGMMNNTAFLYDCPFLS